MIQVMNEDPVQALDGSRAELLGRVATDLIENTNSFPYFSHSKGHESSDFNHAFQISDQHRGRKSIISFVNGLHCLPTR